MKTTCRVCGSHDAVHPSVLCELCAAGYLDDLDEALESDDDRVAVALRTQVALIRVAQGELRQGVVPEDPDELGAELYEQHEWLVANPSWAPALTMHMRDVRDHVRRGGVQ